MNLVFPLFFLVPLISVTAAPCSSCGTVRKSASAMTTEEIDLFKRGFQAVIDKGVMDLFVAEHFALRKHIHHGAQLYAKSPISSLVMPEVGAQRFLPWHRAFLLELETMMRETLKWQGDPDWDKVFLPYWDFSHMDDMPEWAKLENWNPKGTKAVSCEGLPKGVAGYDRPGQTYEIELRRNPGTIPIALVLPKADQVQKILEFQNYLDFATYIDYVPMVMAPPDSPAVGNLLKLLDREDVASFLRPLRQALTGKGISFGERGKIMRAIVRLNNATVMPEMGGGMDKQMAKRVFDAVMQVFRMAPHGVAHLWSAGWDLNDEGEYRRGTNAYFSETAADPLFWMLHCEIDRWWATWEGSVNWAPEDRSKYPWQGPQLTGRDELFTPWDNGSYWTVYGDGGDPALADITQMPYTYDELYK